eukprot:748210-Hanusia_phi.AAC.7
MEPSRAIPVPPNVPREGRYEHVDRNPLSPISHNSANLSNREISPAFSDPSHTDSSSRGVPGSARWLKERTDALEAERLDLVQHTLELQSHLEVLKEKAATAKSIAQSSRFVLAFDGSANSLHWANETETIIEEKKELVSRLIIYSQQAFFMSQGKFSEKKHVANLDLFKLSSLHAQFKRKIRLTIVELQEEQEQIEQQNGKFYQLQDLIQSKSLSSTSRLSLDSHASMMFLLIQEIMATMNSIHGLISTVIQFLQHCYQHRELKSRWRLALSAQVNAFLKKRFLKTSILKWKQLLGLSKNLEAMSFSLQKSSNVRSYANLFSKWKKGCNAISKLGGRLQQLIKSWDQQAIFAHETCRTVPGKAYISILARKSAGTQKFQTMGTSDVKKVRHKDELEIRIQCILLAMPWAYWTFFLRRIKKFQRLNAKFRFLSLSNVIAQWRRISLYEKSISSAASFASRFRASVSARFAFCAWLNALRSRYTVDLKSSLYKDTREDDEEKSDPNICCGSASLERQEMFY